MGAGRPLLLVSFLGLATYLSGCAGGAAPEPTATPSPRAALAHPGLVLYYAFDGTAEDGSGNGNHGDVHGAALSTDRFGIADTAYRFDGLDDDITFDAVPMPQGLADRTISAWVLMEGYPAEWERMPGIGSRATVIGWGIEDWGQLCELQIVDGHLCFHYYGPDSTGSAPLELGRWHHLAIAYGAVPCACMSMARRTGVSRAPSRPFPVKAGSAPTLTRMWTGSITATSRA